MSTVPPLPTNNSQNNITIYKMNEGFNNESFHLYGWKWGHLTITRLFDLVDLKLSSWRPQSNGVKQVIKAIRQVSKYLDSHHHQEDTQVWPFLISHIPEIKEHLDFLDTQHAKWHQLSQEMNEIMDSLEKKKRCTLEERSQLTAKFQEAKNHLYFHLTDEERLLIPFVYRIPKDEQDRLSNIIFNMARADETWRFGLCAMYDTSLHNKEMKAFKKEVPFLIRHTIIPLYFRLDYTWFLNALQV